MMDESVMGSVARRMKARLRGASDLTLERVDTGDLWLRFKVNGEPYSIGPRGETEEEVIASLVYLCGEVGIELLPEIVLTGDTAVVIGEHQFRIAELQQVVTSTPRERVDPGETYTLAEAEVDIDRTARLMMESFVEGMKAGRDPVDSDPRLEAEEHRNPSHWRQAAALFVSRLHGWLRGAPASSGGYLHARRVYEGKPACPRDTDGDGNCGQLTCPNCGPFG